MPRSIFISIYIYIYVKVYYENAGMISHSAKCPVLLTLPFDPPAICHPSMWHTVDPCDLRMANGVCGTPAGESQSGDSAFLDTVSTPRSRYYSCHMASNHCMCPAPLSEMYLNWTSAYPNIGQIMKQPHVVDKPLIATTSQQYGRDRHQQIARHLPPKLLVFQTGLIQFLSVAGGDHGLHDIDNKPFQCERTFGAACRCV